MYPRQVVLKEIFISKNSTFYVNQTSKINALKYVLNVSATSGIERNIHFEEFHFLYASNFKDKSNVFTSKQTKLFCAIPSTYLNLNQTEKQDHFINVVGEAWDSCYIFHIFRIM